MQCLDCGPNAFLMSLFIKYYLNLKFSPFKIALIEERQRERFIVVTDHVDPVPLTPRSQPSSGCVCHAGEIVRLWECHNLYYKWVHPLCLPPQCQLEISSYALLNIFFLLFKSFTAECNLLYDIVDDNGPTVPYFLI